MKALKLTTSQWQSIRQQIDKDYPRSVSMVRWKMKEVLGFTPREHEEWLGHYEEVNNENRLSGRYGYQRSVHLDFYDEAKRTMFLLKYSDFISNSNDRL